MDYSKQYLNKYYARQSKQIESRELALAIITGVIILSVIAQGNMWIAGL